MDVGTERDWQRSPMSVYEVHLGSWQHAENGVPQLSRNRASVGWVCQNLSFTHIELLPITEHPYDASWGYQTTGYFAPTSRFGTADDFRYFVDHLHQRGSVSLDWPAHFPKDSHALARFDGSALYGEHEDPRKGSTGLGNLIFNYGRDEVRIFC